jgi:lipoprotein-releasing system permease protein
VLLLYWLARMCGDGLLFVLEGYGASIELSSRLTRFFFYLLSIPLFPVVITLETAVGFCLFLGDLPGRLFRADRPAPVWLRLPAGLVVLVLSPAWLPVAALIWVAWRLVYEMGVVSLANRLKGETVRGSTQGRFQTFVALRYMRGRKATAGVSVVTGLTILGVTIGVWTLVVVLSVMAGFEADLQDKILGANSHVVVLSYTNEIEDWEGVAGSIHEIDGVVGVTPFIYSEFILRSRHARIGAVLKGIDPGTVGQVTDLPENLTLGPGGRIEDAAEAQVLLNHLDDPGPKMGTPLAEGEEPPEALPGILIGQEMQAALRVTVGDVIQGVSPLSEPGPMGSMSARIIEFEVAGIFHSGMYEYDTKFSYVTLSSARDFLRMGDSVTGMEIVVDDIYEAPAIAGKIGAKLQYPFWTRDWQKMNAPLFAALKLEKLVMGIILTFIVAVASMNIISTLIMLVIEKRREIAIMKAMGAGRFDLMKLFMVDGLLVGFIGTVLGLVAGLATCLALAEWQFIKLESDVYYVDTLPVHISAGLVAAVALVAVGISFLATLFPSYDGSSLDPVEGLRDA